MIAHWKEILTEFRALKEKDLEPWPEPIHNGGWSVFGLYAFGKKLPKNCKKCPQTTFLVEMIPGMVTAGFSRMAPGTIIKPHKGYSNKVWRMHLGLVCPPDCGLRVGKEILTWEEGKMFRFDDTIEHEAWNRSNQERIILLIDRLKGSPQYV